MNQFQIILFLLLLCIIIISIALYYGLKESSNNQDLSIQNVNTKQIHNDSNQNTPHPTNIPILIPSPEIIVQNVNVDEDVRDTPELRKLINPQPNLSSPISDVPIITQPDISKLINDEDVSYLENKSIEVHGKQPLPLPPLKTYELIHDIEPMDCEGMSWGKKCFINPP